MLSLNVEKRDNKTSADKVRAASNIPAVYYGPKQASTSVSILMSDFKKVWKKAGESSVIILKDGSEDHEALIHEVDIHPVSGEPRHADFYVIEKGKKITVKVPLVFAGVSPAVKDKAAILIKVMREIEVEAAPKDLPHDLTVDISSLVEYNDTIHAKDLKVPAGVDLKVGPEEVVASVAEAKEEVVEASTTIDMSAIEVEAKGKEAKEGEAGAEAADAKGDAKNAIGIDAHQHRHIAVLGSGAHRLTKVGGMQEDPEGATQQHRDTESDEFGHRDIEPADMKSFIGIRSVNRAVIRREQHQRKVQQQ